MLDHRLFVRDPEGTLVRLKRRGLEAALLDQLTHLVRSRSEAIQRVESLRQQMNEANQRIQQEVRSGNADAIESARGALKTLKEHIKAGEERQRESTEALESLLLTVPNLPDDAVPEGVDESDNRVERVVGTPRAFDFTPQAHWDLGERLRILDLERAAKISGSRFAVLRGAGARLERALIQLMLDLAREHGYEEVSPPLLVRPETMVGAGQFPKFQGDSFETSDGGHVLIPTAEVPLVNLHREEILTEAELPVRYCAFTPCFRREAGAAGKDTRGLIRQHQFNKVELVSLAHPDHSDAEHQRLTDNAETVLRTLELPYRVVSLCTGDLGFAASKTYDLEVWLPSQQTYREISSCSNCDDFQARRAQIRFRPEGKKTKPRLLHTLNGSGLAVGRTAVALLENGQQADGSVRLPPALVPYFGADHIAPPA